MRCSGVGSKSARSAAAASRTPATKSSRRAPAADRSSRRPPRPYEAKSAGSQSLSAKSARPSLGGLAPAHGCAIHPAQLRATRRRPADDPPARPSPAARFIASSAALGGPDRAASLLGAGAGRAGAPAHPVDDRPALPRPALRLLRRQADRHRRAVADRASIIEAIRAEATNTLLVDNGDYLQGNPMGDYIAYKRGMKPGDVHPVIAGMNTLAYEAGTLGNHEFNYGVEFLDLVNAGADFPIVCANFAQHARGRRRARTRCTSKPYVLLDRTRDRRRRHAAGDPGRADRLRAAADHALGPRAPRGPVRGARHPRGGAGLGAGDARGRAPTSSWRSATRGSTPGPDAAMLENASLPARRGRGDRRGRHRAPAPGLAGEDFAGEGSTRRPGRCSGKPAAMAGFWGSHMGLIDLMLEQRRRAAGGWRRSRRARGRSTSATRTAASPRWSATMRRRSRRRPRCTRRRSTTCARRSGSRRRRCSPTSRWWPTTRRCRSSARRRPGTSPSC